MAEDHSKYMPHHPKPKYAGLKTHPKLTDPMLRARSEPTSHDGSAGIVTPSNAYDQGYYDRSPTGPAPGNVPGMLPGSMG